MVHTQTNTLFDMNLETPVERHFSRDGVRLFAGIDEVGRGALAGPVVTAAVLVEWPFPVEGIRDSKELSAAQRKRLDHEIRAKALAISLDESPAEEVDRLNVLEATRLSMQRALAGLPVRPELVLVDAMDLKLLDSPFRSLIRGDKLSISIGAASIVAKVYRDGLMSRLAETFPAYGFDVHKGYGTSRHLEAIREHGPCPFHRMSFKPFLGSRQDGSL